MGDIKIGNSNITLKLGSSDVTAAYLGSTLVYSGSTPPAPTLQWVTFTNEKPQTDTSGLYQIYGIKFNSLDLDSSAENIYIYNENTDTESTFQGCGRGKCDFISWDECRWTSSSSEDIELDLTNGYEDICGNETTPPYYLDTIPSDALLSMTYQLLIYQ